MRILNKVKKVVAGLLLALVVSSLLPSGVAWANSNPNPDEEAPIIATQADVTAVATSAAGAIVTYEAPVVTDNVDPDGVATCAPVSGSLFGIGTTEVTCNAKDVAGNSAEPVTFDVIVSAPDPVIDSVYVIRTDGAYTYPNPKPVLWANVSGLLDDSATCEYQWWTDQDTNSGWLAGTFSSDGDGKGKCKSADLDLNVAATVFSGKVKVTNTWAGVTESEALNLSVWTSKKPNVVILGNNPDEVTVGGSYTDPGAVAYDLEDGDLTDKIKTENNINLAKVGTYQIKYSVTDLDENTTEVERTVRVIPRNVTVTANNQTKSFGTADPSLTYSYVGDLMIGDSFTGALTRVPGEEVGTYAINKGTLALSENYVITFVDGTFSITPEVKKEEPKVIVLAAYTDTGSEVKGEVKEKGQVGSGITDKDSKDDKNDDKNIPAFGIAVLVLLILFGAYLLYQQKPEWFAWMFFWKKKKK